MSGSEDDEAAMAAFMGFSSFGAKVAKKRKFNAATDAFVEGQELEKIDRGGKKGKGSGGNDIPLGKPRTFGTSTKNNEDETIPDLEEDVSMDAACNRVPSQQQSQRNNEARPAETKLRKMPLKMPEPTHLNTEEENNDEILLHDDPKVQEADVDGGRPEFTIRSRRQHTGTSIGSSDEDVGPSYVDTSRTPPADITYEHEQEAPRYVDTSLPPPAAMVFHPVVPEPQNEVSTEEAAEMQRRIDSILSSIGSDAAPTANTLPTDPDITSHPPCGNLGTKPTFPPPLENLPNRLPASHARVYADSKRGGITSRSGRGASRGGSSRQARNLEWYVDYYDPSFNANPWERLEKDNGLQPVGSWL